MFEGQYGWKMPQDVEIDVFSRSGQSFLMYAKRGRSWIALFDPVGPRSE